MYTRTAPNNATRVQPSKSLVTPIPQRWRNATVREKVDLKADHGAGGTPGSETSPSHAQRMSNDCGVTLVHPDTHTPQSPITKSQSRKRGSGVPLIHDSHGAHAHLRGALKERKKPMATERSYLESGKTGMLLRSSLIKTLDGPYLMSYDCRTAWARKLPPPSDEPATPEEYAPLLASSPKVGYPI